MPATQWQQQRLRSARGFLFGLVGRDDAFLRCLPSIAAPDQHFSSKRQGYLKNKFFSLALTFLQVDFAECRENMSNFVGRPCFLVWLDERAQHAAQSVKWKCANGGGDVDSSELLPNILGGIRKGNLVESWVLEK